ncbi:MAG: Ig-like domain-containing protein [Oscillospiraceae bacterium]|nr:Ig-like domain-containing protein [Oscillospiraceae bacterium]
MLMTLIVLAFPHDAMAWGINKSNISLVKGQAYTLKVTGVSSVPEWSSSNVNVASVSKTGKVSAKSAGTAVITAKVGSSKVSCTVNVKAGSLKASASSLSVKAGSSKIIYITAKGSHAVKVTSSNKKVAKASWAESSFTNNRIGLRIRGVSNGNATIKVYMSRYTNIYTNISVNVYGGSSAATDLSTTVSSVSVNVGSQSTFTVTSSSAANTRFTVSDGDIARCAVSQWTGNRANVRITGRSAGNTYLNITNNNTGTTKSIPIYVKGTNMSLSKTSGRISVGGTDTISVTTSNPRNISVYSSNPGVASAQVTHIYNTSCNVTVTGRQAGTATITVTDNVSGISRNYTATVGSSLRASVSNLSVKLNGSNDFTVYTNNPNYLQISSSNSATVQAGVSRIGNGNAVVTVYAYRQGNVTLTIKDTYTNETIKVQISVAGTGLRTSVSSISLKKDQTSQFTVYCTDPNYIDVTSSNTGVATVYTSDWDTVNGRLVVNVFGQSAGNSTVRVYDRLTNNAVNVTAVVSGGNNLSVSPSSLRLRGNGQTASFTVTCDNPAYVSAYSADNSVATVYEGNTSGTSKVFRVVPGPQGSTTITITDNYTGRTVYVNVTVEPEGQTSMQVGASSLRLTVGQNESFTVRCNNASLLNVSSSNSSVAVVSVQTTGSQSAVVYVTGAGAGSATINLYDGMTGEQRSVSVSVTGNNNNNNNGVYYDDYNYVYYY